MPQEQITLFHSPSAFLSQKVAFALYEKKVPFLSRIVNLSNKENEEAWFLKVNPKGRVPVLKHGDRYITVATTIIDYLDRTFDGPKMFPNFTSDEGRMAEKYHIMFTNISVEMMTYRLKMEDEKCKMKSESDTNCQAFEVTTRPQGYGQEVTVDINMSELTKHAASAGATGGKDAGKQPPGQNNHTIEHLLGLLNNAFDAVEQELKAHADMGRPDNWLCGEDFNIADIVLTLILHRTRLAGWSKCTWEDGMHPYIVRYYCMARLRDSYKSVFDPMQDNCEEMECEGKTELPFRCEPPYPANCTPGRPSDSFPFGPCRPARCEPFQACNPCGSGAAGGGKKMLVHCPPNALPVGNPFSPGVPQGPCPQGCSCPTECNDDMGAPDVTENSFSAGIRGATCGNPQTCETFGTCGEIKPKVCVTDDGIIEFQCQDGTKVRCRTGNEAQCTSYKVCDDTGCSEAVVVSGECPPFVISRSQDTDFFFPVIMGCTVVAITGALMFCLVKSMSGDDFDCEPDYSCRGR